MPEICGNLARSIRNLAREGYAMRWIARRHNLDAGDVDAFLKTPLCRDRPLSAKRQIRGKLVARVLDLGGRGWSPADIAAALDLRRKTVAEFLARYRPVRRGTITRPRTRREQEALERNERARRRRQARAPKFVDEWKAAALTDPAFRDPVSPLEDLETSELPAIAAAEVLDQVAVEELPPVAWSGPTSPHASASASGPRKLTAAVLAEALELRQAGWSWPAIARKLGCHRMALYHALRR
jgi:hypothetical protein